jgi:hypothetical protein
MTRKKGTMNPKTQKNEKKQKKQQQTADIPK